MFMDFDEISGNCRQLLQGSIFCTIFSKFARKCIIFCRISGKKLWGGAHSFGAPSWLCIWICSWLGAPKLRGLLGNRRLFLRCMDRYDSEPGHSLQHFPSYTRLTDFCTAYLSNCQILAHGRIFAEVLEMLLQLK